MVVVEDIHWAEAALLELLEYLPATIRGLPVLIIAVTRTEIFDTRPNFAAAVSGAKRIDLQPLDGAEAKADGAPDGRCRHGGRPLPPGVRELRRQPPVRGGLVRMLIDERHLEQDPSTFAMPATIHAVLAARLDRLDPN